MNQSHYIESLKASKKTQPLLDKLKEDLANGKFDRLTKLDANDVAIPVIYIETKGKGEREYLQDVKYLLADTGVIGESMGNIYLYNTSRTFGLPRRFKLDADRILKRHMEE